MQSKTGPALFLRSENLTFLAAILGVLVGLFVPGVASSIGFLGDLFLALLKMTILPLILVSVFLAVAQQASQAELSKIGGRTILYFMTSTGLACVLGLFCAQIFLGTPEIPDDFAKYDSSKLGSASLDKILLGFITTNPFKSLAQGDIIQIVVFSLFMGALSTKLSKEHNAKLIEVAEAANELVLLAIRFIVRFAPIGVFALVVSVVASTEIKAFAKLGGFFLAVGVAALTHSLITLPAMGYFFGGFNPYRFLFNVKEALLVALATASSNATLPVSTRVMEEKEKVDPRTTRFVLPLGATLNMDGSALYQSILVIFLGGIAGIHFNLAQQMQIFLFVIISSAGTAGIPSGGIVMVGAMLELVGIPLEYLGIYLLVDRFWDPPVTMINVMGDLFGSKIIDKWMGRRPQS